MLTRERVSIQTSGHDCNSRTKRSLTKLGFRVSKVTHGRDRVVGTMLRGPLPTYSVVDKHAMSFLGLIEVLTSWLFDLT